MLMMMRPNLAYWWQLPFGTRVRKRPRNVNAIPVPYTEITRHEEFDAGHRIPNHGSKCRNAHGHRYVLEVTVRGPVSQEAGSASEGMVIDFSRLKTVMMEEVVDPWDHAFLVYDRDGDMLAALSHLGSHRTIILREVPSVENLVNIAYRKIYKALQDAEPRLRITKVRMYETPKSWADAVIIQSDDILKVVSDGVDRRQV
jgi:6-pyruvoyltetrahydropterin/6-carboxytetrahydropterin synthase